LTGGIGGEELQRFYGEFFFSGAPDPKKRQQQQSSLALTTTLLSRTASTDRVVDELHVSLRHRVEVPWLLPGIPPTGRKVEVILVSIMALRGGKLVSEHVYWDQASVLLQAGLLDPVTSIPEKAKEKGAERLPVVGRDGARRMLTGLYEGEDGEADNDLLDGWYSDEKQEEEGKGDDYGREYGYENEKYDDKRDDEQGESCKKNGTNKEKADGDVQLQQNNKGKEVDLPHRDKDGQD